MYEDAVEVVKKYFEAGKTEGEAISSLLNAGYSPADAKDIVKRARPAPATRAARSSEPALPPAMAPGPRKGKGKLALALAILLLLGIGAYLYLFGLPTITAYAPISEFYKFVPENATMFAVAQGTSGLVDLVAPEEKPEGWDSVEKALRTIKKTNFALAAQRGSKNVFVLEGDTSLTPEVLEFLEKAYGTKLLKEETVQDALVKSSEAAPKEGYTYYEPRRYAYSYFKKYHIFGDYELVTEVMKSFDSPKFSVPSELASRLSTGAFYLYTKSAYGEPREVAFSGDAKSGIAISKYDSSDKLREAVAKIPKRISSQLLDVEYSIRTEGNMAIVNIKGTSSLIMAYGGTAAAAIWYWIGSMGRPAVPVEEVKDFIVENCLPGTEQMRLYNNGAVTISAATGRLLDKNRNVLDSSIEFSAMSPGSRSTITTTYDLQAGETYSYYLEYPGIPLERFGC